MTLRTWFVTTAQLAVVLAALEGCGEESGSSDSDDQNEETKDDGGNPPQDGAIDGGVDAGPMTFVPPEENLPIVPPDSPDSGAPPGAMFFGKRNPVIYLNDYPDSVYTDAYVYALAANDVIKLVGVVSSGIDCKVIDVACTAGDNKDSSPRRQEWIEAARDAGFANIPNNTAGSWSGPMMAPDSGVLADTARIPSAGADLIVQQAKLATREVPLLVVSGGAITTLAQAYLQDPSITQTIVVSWLAGSFEAGRTPEISLDAYNSAADRWAAEIVLRNFRVFIFPTDLDAPIVPECRIAEAIPDSPLRDLLFASGYFMSGHDADGAPAVTINFPAYMRDYTRLAMTTGFDTVPDPKGNLWLLRSGDAAGGGEEFFKTLRQAYKVAPDAGSFAGDAGCAP